MRPRARFSIFSGSRFMGDIDIVGRPAKKNDSWWALIGFVLSILVVLLCIYLLISLIF